MNEYFFLASLHEINRTAIKASKQPSAVDLEMLRVASQMVGSLLLRGVDGNTRI